MTQCLFRIITDSFIEMLIDSQLKRISACNALGDTEGAREAWNKAKDLIAYRSPEKVKQMEVEKGLRG